MPDAPAPTPTTVTGRAAGTPTGRRRPRSSPAGSSSDRRSRAPAIRTWPIVGDLNSYAGEDPIAALEAAGYTNLVKAFHGDDAYSYVFDGQWGYLDYVMASSSLRRR